MKSTKRYFLWKIFEISVVSVQEKAHRNFRIFHHLFRNIFEHGVNIGLRLCLQIRNKSLVISKYTILDIVTENEDTKA